MFRIKTALPICSCGRDTGMLQYFMERVCTAVGSQTEQYPAQAKVIHILTSEEAKYVDMRERLGIEKMEALMMCCRKNLICLSVNSIDCRDAGRSIGYVFEGGTPKPESKPYPSPPIPE